MPSVEEQIRVNRAKRARDARIALEVAGWVVLLIVVFVVWLVLLLLAHFDCGGTFGGPGEAAGARVDRSCYRAKTNRATLVWLFPAVLIALRVGRRRRTSRAAP